MDTKKYKAYNVMEKNNKSIGRAYLVGMNKKSESKTDFKNRIIKENHQWNKKVGLKTGALTKLVKISAVTKKPAKKGLFGL